jgi:hypothetical protein
MSISVAGCNKRSTSEVQNDSEMNNGVGIVYVRKDVNSEWEQINKGY